MNMDDTTHDKETTTHNTKQPLHDYRETSEERERRDFQRHRFLYPTAWEMHVTLFGGVRGTPRNSSACKQQGLYTNYCCNPYGKRPPITPPSLRLTKPK
ncbi:hypothetical protein TNCV_3741741 [Trichonephila clavipes]|nr:hypothetical protein TNCV_3741741 [Trichonephila clavipes]